MFTFIKEVLDAIRNRKEYKVASEQMKLVIVYRNWELQKMKEKEETVRCRVCLKNKEENGGSFSSPGDRLCSERCEIRYWTGRNSVDIGRGVEPIWP